MNIYDILKNAAYVTKCNSTCENKYIMELDKNDFWDVYREIKMRDTFLIIDKKGEINFYINLEGLDLLKHLSGSNNISINADWNYYGPEIILNIDGFGRIPGFILELEKKLDAFILQRFFKNHEVFVQYIIQDEKGIIKLFTEKIQMNNEFIERLKYYIELDFYKMYPRITEEKTGNEKGYYIKTNNDIKILEEILEIVQESKAQMINVSTTVYAEDDEFYKIIFFGDIQIILDRLLKKINIIEEGSTEVKGKPFFRYKNGLLYFFENSNIINTGGNVNECI